MNVRRGLVSSENSRADLCFESAFFWCFLFACCFYKFSHSRVTRKISAWFCLRLPRRVSFRGNHDNKNTRFGKKKKPLYIIRTEGSLCLFWGLWKIRITAFNMVILYTIFLYFSRGLRKILQIFFFRHVRTVYDRRVFLISYPVVTYAQRLEFSRSFFNCSYFWKRDKRMV